MAHICNYLGHRICHYALESIKVVVLYAYLYYKHKRENTGEVGKTFDVTSRATSTEQRARSTQAFESPGQSVQAMQVTRPRQGAL